MTERTERLRAAERGRRAEGHKGLPKEGSAERRWHAAGWLKEGPA